MLSMFARFTLGAVENVAFFDTVDVFNATAGSWSTAALSAARSYVAATSLPNFGLAIFAGGAGGSM